MPKNSNRDAIVSRLAELLREERTKRKLSLSEIAARSGLSHTMVSRVEKRERLPTIDTLLRITEAIGVSLPALIQRAVDELG